MSSKMLYEAIALIREGKLDEARRMIFEIIRSEPTNEMAWMWLAETLSSDSDRMKVLQACLLENPSSKITNMAIEKLKEKMDEEKEQASSVSPFREDATFDPSMPERTGHTGAIIGFDGSFIVSEISDFDDVIDLRKGEEEVSPFKMDEPSLDNELDSTQVYASAPSPAEVPASDEPAWMEQAPTETSAEEIQETHISETPPKEPESELEYEPDLSNLFQNEKDFDFGTMDSSFSDDDQFSSLFSESEQTGEHKDEELTAFDLGFIEDDPTVIAKPPEEPKEELDEFRSMLHEEGLVEDHVIQSGVEEYERRRKKKDRNLVALVIGLFVIIALLCVAAIYVIMNYTNIVGLAPMPTSTLVLAVPTTEVPTATEAPTLTPTVAPTATPTSVPTTTPLVALGDRAISAENAGSLQLKLQKEYLGLNVVSLDGKQVAFADGKTISVWNPANGVQLYELHEHSANVTSLVFSDDGKYLVSAANDFTVYLWNLNLGILEKRFVIDGNAVNRVFGSRSRNMPDVISVDFSPDSTTIAAGTFGLVTIFDVPSGLARGSFEFSADELNKVTSQNGSPQAFKVKFNGNGWVLVAGMSGHLVGLDTLDASPLYQFELGANARINFADNRQEMIEVDTGGVALRKMDTGEIFNGFDGAENPSDSGYPQYALSENWNVIGIETNDEQSNLQLSVWRIDQDEKVADFPAVCDGDNCRIPNFVISGNGNWVAVEARDDQNSYLRLFDLENYLTMPQLEKFIVPIQAIDASPSSQLIAVLTQNGVLRIWDVKFGAQRVSLDATGMEKIKFSNDGQFLFAWNKDKFSTWALP